LIVRERDARDKRRIVLSLTAAGRRLDVPTPRTVESATSRVLARITSRDRAATLRCLRAITDELSTGESRRARA
jgi:DNA-binding MarR family transcriptional regulator